ncbi:MAG: septal ring lytic transglycosylase RlpA family protein [Pseudomonadota bacterium]
MQTISTLQKKLGRASKFLLMLTLCLSIAMVAACGGKKTIHVDHDPDYSQSTPPTDSSVQYPKGPPKSDRAKPYTVLGQTYYPLKSAHGFVEEGVASWYGRDFHGKKTANGERYDMYGMTAAHRILPFNTKLKVTNLNNGKSIIVRVNDRGPFVNNRIIDLTKTAAEQLGMIGPGTARVRVEAIGTSPHMAEQGNLTGNFYLQIGAFSSQENARSLAHRMRSSGHKSRYFFASNVGFWRVQLGPWTKLRDAERAQHQLQNDFPHATVVAE